MQLPLEINKLEIPAYDYDAVYKAIGKIIESAQEWEEEYRNCVKMHNITMNNLERKTLVKINQKLKKKKIITQEEYVTLSKIIEERNKINHDFFIVTMKNYEGNDKWEYIKNYLNVVWSIIFEARDIVENIANKNNPNHIHVQTMIDAK